MKSSSVIVAVIVLLLLGVGGFVLTRKKPITTNPTTNTTSSTNETSNTGTQSEGNQTSANNAQQSESTITYTDNGFAPSSLTVKSGTTVTIKNESSNLLQFNSDPHPVHTDNPELNVGSISPGQSKTFKATTTGTHGYHNHLNSSDQGTLIVE